MSLWQGLELAGRLTQHSPDDANPMLLNIDKLHLTAILHNGDCRGVPKPHGTPHKPIGKMGRDGGWFEAGSVEEAKEVATKEYPRAEFRRCSRC